MAAGFKNKSTSDISKWLLDGEFNENVISAFEDCKAACVHVFNIILTLLTEDEVDRDKFLLLTDKDIGKMVKPWVYNESQ